MGLYWLKKKVATEVLVRRFGKKSDTFIFTFKAQQWFTFVCLILSNCCLVAFPPPSKENVKFKLIIIITCLLKLTFAIFGLKDKNKKIYLKSTNLDKFQGNINNCFISIFYIL